MKVKSFVLLCLLASGLQGLSQDAATASAIADRQEAEERYRRMSADVEGLLSANAALQRRISAIADELRRLRDDHERLEKNSTVQDEIRRLAKKIEEVDQKRIEDRELILKEMKELTRLLSAAPPSRSNFDPPSSRTHGNEETKPLPDKGYEYTIQSGDTVATVLAAYNAEFKKNGQKPLSLKQVLEANPGLNPNRIRVGQKIFIPLPPN